MIWGTTLISTSFFTPIFAFTGPFSEITQTFSFFVCYSSWIWRTEAPNFFLKEFYADLRNEIGTITYTHIIFFHIHFRIYKLFLRYYTYFPIYFLCVIDHRFDALEHPIFFSQKNNEDLLNELENYQLYSIILHAYFRIYKYFFFYIITKFTNFSCVIVHESDTPEHPILFSHKSL